MVHCRENICSEINRCLDNMLQHISVKIDNLHKLYFKFTQRNVFIIILTIFVHFCIFKREQFEGYIPALLLCVLKYITHFFLLSDVCY